jgi:hypothetical protein
MNWVRRADGSDVPGTDIPIGRVCEVRISANYK